MLSGGMYDQEVQGPWIMEDVNYNFYHSTSLTNMEEAEEKDAFEWNSDNENTLVFLGCVETLVFWFHVFIG
jgi:hypothetical protein